MKIWRKDQKSEEYINSLLAKINFTLVGEYINQALPIKVKCNVCGDLVGTRIVNIKRGSKPVCSCNPRNYEKYDEEKISKFLNEKNLKPLEAYVGNTKKPWKMLCTVCNNEIKPELYNLKRGQGCWFCADSNKKYDENIGRLYLIHNHKENIIKVGITNESGNRMKKYNQDWKIIRYIQFSKGKTAYKYEKKVLNKWRNDLNLPIALSRDTRLLMDGYTETANESGLDDAIKIIDKCLFNKEATVVKLDRSC